MISSRRSSIRRSPIRAASIARRTTPSRTRSGRSSSAGARPCGSGRRTTCWRSDRAGAGSPCTRRGRAAAACAASRSRSEQLALSRQRVEAAGLQDRVSLEFCDYRDVRGQFSQRHLHRDDRGRGRGVLARVLRDDRLGAGPGRPRRHPGDHDGGRTSSTPIAGTATGSRSTSSRAACCHRSAKWRRCARRHTRLGLIGLEDRAARLRPDAARRGGRRSSAGSIRCATLGFDDRFIRMWEFYLASCEAAFRTRNLGLVHLVLARAGEDLR